MIQFNFDVFRKDQMQSYLLLNFIHLHFSKKVTALQMLSIEIALLLLY